ncbi:MAG: hypothetical protein ABW061_17530 [Polyangiaceae bacterium]
MSLLDLADVTRENFSITTIRGERSPTFAFAGNADMDAIAALGIFLRNLERAALEQRVALVTCDVRQLYFMNSSCFKCFVLWVNAIAGLSSELQYAVEFIANPGMRWQVRSLENLQHFGPSIIRITVQT